MVLAFIHARAVLILFEKHLPSFLSGHDYVQSHRPIPGRHRSHLFGKLETFSTITLHGAGCFVSKAMARICISAKSIFPPVVEKMLMVAGASPALVSSLLIRSDQLRLSTFGFRSARSTLSAQWSILRFVVQLSYRSSFATLRFAARSPSLKRAGLDSGYR